MYKIHYILIFSLLLINSISTLKKNSDAEASGSGTGVNVDKEKTRCQLTDDTDCTSEGDYEQIQCQKKFCWCVDSETGTLVIGSKRKAKHNEMHCSKESSGSEPKVEKTLCEKMKMKCTPDGDFAEVQCKDGYCWCVDQDTGKKLENSIKKLHSSEMDCDTEGSASFPTTKYQEPTKTTKSPNEIDDESIEESGDDGNDLNIPNIQRNDHTNSIMRSSIIAKPGMLVGLICGAVVGLLCAVLLVMFIVYRMRKKDEGSYALDESKRGLTSSNAAYTKSPKEKEYFA